MEINNNIHTNITHLVSIRSHMHLDEITYNKIQRHLTDITDTITEEDIRNIKIFTAIPELSELKSAE